MNMKFASVGLLAMAVGLSATEVCRAAAIVQPPPPPPPSVTSTVTAPTLPPPSVTTTPPVVTGGKQFSFSGYTQTVTFPPPGGGTVTITMGGTGNTDPFASYSLDISNTTSASVDILVNYYMALTGTGITGLTNEADIFGSLIKGSAALVSPSTDVQTILLTTDTVTPTTDLTTLTYSTNAGLDVGSSSFVTGLSSATTEDGPVFAPTPAGGPFTAMDIQVQFELGANSEIRLRGDFNAPEPASLVCWSCLGLVAAGAMYRRSHRQPG